MEHLAQIKASVEQVGKNFEEFKATVSQAKKDGDVLLEEKLKKIGDDITVKLEAHQKELDRLGAGKNPAATQSADAHEKAEKDALLFSQMRTAKQGEYRPKTDLEPSVEITERYRKSFDRYARVGEKMLSPDELKDMSIGSDPDGGAFILPPTVARNVIVRMFETSPMRALANVMTIGTRSWIQPEDPSDIGAGWVTERQARPATTSTQPSRKEIVAQEEYAEPTVTQQLLEDSMIDIEAYLSKRIADKLARLENTAFVNGNGVGQPRGLMTYPAGTTWGKQIEQIGSGTSGSFTYNGLIKLITSLKDVYQGNAQFMIRRQSISAIMTLTDSNGRYIFQPILNGDFNNTPLLGYKLRYATDVADIAAGALAAGFGDFDSGYQIVDRVGLSTIRDNLTAKPNVLFYTRKRVGGDVVDFDAIKIQVLT